MRKAMIQPEYSDVFLSGFYNLANQGRLVIVIRMGEVSNPGKDKPFDFIPVFPAYRRVNFRKITFRVYAAQLIIFFQRANRDLKLPNMYSSSSYSPSRLSSAYLRLLSPSAIFLKDTPLSFSISGSAPASSRVIMDE